MKGLPHPNIHPVIGACIDDKLPPYILYPYSTEGNLKKFLHKCRISDCNSHYVSGCLISLFSALCHLGKLADTWGSHLLHLCISQFVTV